MLGLLEEGGWSVNRSNLCLISIKPYIPARTLPSDALLDHY